MNMSQNDRQNRRVVLTGLGTINPIAGDVPEFWKNLIAGKSGVRLARRTDLSDFSIKIAGEVDLPENITDFMPKKFVRRFGRFIVLAQIAATQALLDSGLDADQIGKDPGRFGVIMGTGDADAQNHFDMCRRIDRHGLDSVSPFYVVGIIPSTPSSYFAMHHNFQGPNYSINSACATSSHSIGTAAGLIKLGQADVMISGGTEAILNQAGFGGFGIIAALSCRNDSPKTASRPFDRDRDGFVLSEGAGALCLEELEHARKRGARIYAELTGYGFSCDAHDLVAPHPQGIGAAAAISNALAEAGLDKDRIDLINAHGTSTVLGDVAEARALHRVFGDRAARIPVHSTKSMLGHTIGAAGSTEAIAAVQAIQQGVAHPSINLFEQDPEIDLNVIANQPREMRVDHVLSNSFGFGGQNAALVISRFE